jgi:hypothetical protein
MLCNTEALATAQLAAVLLSAAAVLITPEIFSEDAILPVQ